MTNKTILALGVSVIAVATVAHVIYWETRSAGKRAQDPVRKVLTWLKNK
ncbi:hypothetical protein [Leuconostoc lactis]